MADGQWEQWGVALIEGRCRRCMTAIARWAGPRGPGRVIGAASGPRAPHSQMGKGRTDRRTNPAMHDAWSAYPPLNPGRMPTRDGRIQDWVLMPIAHSAPTAVTAKHASVCAGKILAGKRVRMWKRAGDEGGGWLAGGVRGMQVFAEGRCLAVCSLEAVAMFGGICTM